MSLLFMFLYSMSLQKIKYFLYGIFVSASIVSVVTYATWPDGVFGDYFQNIINSTWVCNDANSVVTSFDDSLGSSYGTKICRTIKDLVSSLGIYNVAGNIGIGTNSPNAHLTVSGSLQIKDGTQWDGKVLTSDATWKASWKTISGVWWTWWQKVLRGRATVGFFNGNPESEHTTVSFGETCTNARVSANPVEWSISIKCSNASNTGIGVCPSYNTSDSQDLHAYAFNITNTGFKTMLSWMDWVWVWWSSPAYPIDWIAVCDETVWWGTSSNIWWENVPLTDTNDFDVTCEYRYKELYVIDDANRKWTNSTFGWGYPWNVSPKYLWQVLSWINYYGVPSTDKSKYAYRDNVWNEIFTTNVVIDKIEKRCWNSTQSWYKKVCDVAYAAPSFAAPTSSHMHSLPVPDSWTSETCRWYMWQTKWWAAETHYRLGCIESSGVSQWTYSSVNAWTADAWIPATNCGW